MVTHFVVRLMRNDVTRVQEALQVLLTASERSTAVRDCCIICSKPIGYVEVKVCGRC